MKPVTVRKQRSLRTALVLAGGAATAAYQCGVLKAFQERNLKFDVVIGSSAGAYNGIRYLADQMDVCERVFLSDLPGLFRPFNLILPGRNFMDLDYLVDEIGLIKRPMDIERVRASPSEFFITALEPDTWRTRYFNVKRHDIPQLLRATAAIPLLYSGRILINGRRYLDGGILAPVPLAGAIELGCTEIYAILNTATFERSPVIERAFAGMPGRMSQLLAAHNRIRREMDEFMEQPHEGLRIKVVRPDRPLPAGGFTTDEKKIRALVDMGYRDGVEFPRGDSVDVSHSQPRRSRKRNSAYTTK